MIFELLKDTTTLALIVASLYFALRLYVRRRRPDWAGPLARRRLAVLLLLVLAVITIKVTEDVLGGESGPVDNLILAFIHAHVPPESIRFFELITLSGSFSVLLPLTSVATLALLVARRRLEALLLASSVLAGALVVYVIKMAVGRVRPALWVTDAYWGFSFPSGHTLVVAALATAAVLIVDRIWPAAHRPALLLALAWTLLVGISRMVIGVHWPTDVLAATCIGAFLPLAMGIALKRVRS